jgi:hypothetical protein
MTSEQYNNVGRKLDQANLWPPDGLLAHVAFGAGGGLHLSEVWESREQQQRFGEKLLPLLQDENIQLSGEPQFLEVEGYLFVEASSATGD